LLDFPNGCLCGVAKTDGSSHILNPPDDYQVQPDEELLILAEDDHILHHRYTGPLKLSSMPEAAPVSGKPVEHMLILGWNEKIFPVLQEFDNYVGPSSSLTLVNSVEADERARLFAEKDVVTKNATVRHVVGEFTSRKLMEKVEP